MVNAGERASFRVAGQRDELDDVPVADGMSRSVLFATLTEVTVQIGFTVSKTGIFLPPVDVVVTVYVRFVIRLDRELVLVIERSQAVVSMLLESVELELWEVSRCPVGVEVESLGRDVTVPSMVVITVFAVFEAVIRSSGVTMTTGPPGIVL